MSDCACTWCQRYRHRPAQLAALADVLAQARAEIDAEDRRAAIDAAKVRLRTRRPWWHRICPFVITITRRTP